MSSKKLQPLVFQGRNTEGFEIAFTAFLCTVVLQLPQLEPVSESVMIGAVLLLITIALVRFMAYSSDYRSNNRILPSTQLLIEAITIAVVLYVVTVALTGLEVPQFGIYILVILIPVSLIFLHEVLFGDFFIYYAAAAYDLRRKVKEIEQNSQSESRTLESIISVFELLLKYKMAISQAQIPPRISELEEFNVQIDDTNEDNLLKLFLLSFFAVNVALLVPLLGIHLLVGVTLFHLAVAAWTIIYLRIIIRFWYIAYGLSGGIDTSWPVKTMQFFFYTILALVMFGWI